MVNIASVKMFKKDSIFAWSLIVFRRFPKLQRQLLASSYLSFRPSVCVEQLGFYWTDIRKICYLNIFPKFVEKIQVSLKFGKNSQHCR